jgi:hypothetical protein
MRLKVTALQTNHDNIDEMLKALNIGREQIATIEVAMDAGVADTANGRFIAQDDSPGQGITIWRGESGHPRAVGTRDLEKGDKVVWFDPSLPQT